MGACLSSSKNNKLAYTVDPETGILYDPTHLPCQAPAADVLSPTAALEATCAHCQSQGQRAMATTKTETEAAPAERKVIYTSRGVSVCDPDCAVCKADKAVQVEGSLRALNLALSDVEHYHISGHSDDDRNGEAVAAAAAANHTITTATTTTATNSCTSLASPLSSPSPPPSPHRHRHSHARRMKRTSHRQSRSHGHSHSLRHRQRRHYPRSSGSGAASLGSLTSLSSFRRGQHHHNQGDGRAVARAEAPRANNLWSLPAGGEVKEEAPRDTTATAKVTTLPHHHPQHHVREEAAPLAHNASMRQGTEFYENLFSQFPTFVSPPAQYSSYCHTGSRANPQPVATTTTTTAAAATARATEQATTPLLPRAAPEADLLHSAPHDYAKTYQTVETVQQQSPETVSPATGAVPPLALHATAGTLHPRMRTHSCSHKCTPEPPVQVASPVAEPCLSSSYAFPQEGCGAKQHAAGVTQAVPGSRLQLYSFPQEVTHPAPAQLAQYSAVASPVVVPTVEHAVQETPNHATQVSTVTTGQYPRQCWPLPLSPGTVLETTPLGLPEQKIHHTAFSPHALPVLQTCSDGALPQREAAYPTPCEDACENYAPPLDNYFTPKSPVRAHVQLPHNDVQTFQGLQAPVGPAVYPDGTWKVPQQIYSTPCLQPHQNPQHLSAVASQAYPSTQVQSPTTQVNCNLRRTEIERPEYGCTFAYK